MISLQETAWFEVGLALRSHAKEYLGTRGVCYHFKNGVFFSKILNFYSTFLNVKKNSIFD
jgi:hypothetical protein